MVGRVRKCSKQENPNLQHPEIIEGPEAHYKLKFLKKVIKEETEP